MAYESVLVTGLVPAFLLSYLYGLLVLTAGQAPQGLGVPGPARACFSSDSVILKTYFLPFMVIDLKLI